MLRDWVVCRIGDSHIQKCLLAEPDLTFDKAVELAVAQESAEQNAVQLQKPLLTTTAHVHKLGGSTPKQQMVKSSLGHPIIVEESINTETVHSKMLSVTDVIKKTSSSSMSLQSHSSPVTTNSKISQITTKFYSPYGRGRDYRWTSYLYII